MRPRYLLFIAPLMTDHIAHRLAALLAEMEESDRRLAALASNRPRVDRPPPTPCWPRSAPSDPTAPAHRGGFFWPCGTGPIVKTSRRTGGSRSQAPTRCTYIVWRRRPLSPPVPFVLCIPLMSRRPDCPRPYRVRRDGRHRLRCRRPRRHRGGGIATTAGPCPDRIGAARCNAAAFKAANLAALGFWSA